MFKEFTSSSFGICLAFWISKILKLLSFLAGPSLGCLVGNRYVNFNYLRKFGTIARGKESSLLLERINESKFVHQLIKTTTICTSSTRCSVTYSRLKTLWPLTNVQFTSSCCICSRFPNFVLGDFDFVA